MSRPWGPSPLAIPTVRHRGPALARRRAWCAGTCHYSLGRVSSPGTAPRAAALGIVVGRLRLGVPAWGAESSHLTDDTAPRTRLEALPASGGARIRPCGPCLLSGAAPRAAARERIIVRPRLGVTVSWASLLATLGYATGGPPPLLSSAPRVAALGSVNCSAWNSVLRLHGPSPLSGTAPWAATPGLVNCPASTRRHGLAGRVLGPC